MPAARAEVWRTTLFKRPATPAAPASQFVLVEYKFVDTEIAGAIPFDEVDFAPAVGQFIEVSAQTSPNLQHRIGEDLNRFNRDLEALQVSGGSLQV